MPVPIRLRLAQPDVQQRADVGRIAAAEVSSPVAFSSTVVVRTAWSGAEPGDVVIVTLLK